MTACELRTEGPRCNSLEALFASVHEVSLLNATNPPSLNGTISWRFALSCADAIAAHARQQNAMVITLLLIADSFL
jgi:hypothetical protein